MINKWCLCCTSLFVPIYVFSSLSRAIFRAEVYHWIEVLYRNQIETCVRVLSQCFLELLSYHVLCFSVKQQQQQCIYLKKYKVYNTLSPSNSYNANPGSVLWMKSFESFILVASFYYCIFFFLENLQLVWNNLLAS